MNKNTFKKALATAATCLSCTAALSAPSGVEGKDWAYEKITIKSGAAVKVTVTNYSQGEQRDNASRVTLQINRKVVIDETQRQETASKTHILSGDGSYELELICRNERAIAKTCSITLEEQIGKVFGGK